MRSVPTSPGVYRWLDCEGNILYVGKAKNLRNRLRSYLNANAGKSLGPWKESMMRTVTDFAITVTATELEALMLETNFIKQQKPKFNVLMKDDKNYVYVRVSLQDPYPRVDVVRVLKKDGAKYFGPKTSASDVQKTLKVLRKIFPFRTCMMTITPDPPASDDPLRLSVTCTHRDRPTPCLDYHMKQCSAPCIGSITPEAYRREIIDGVLTFFRGDHSAVVALLTERMKHAAAAKQFELAATVRNHLTMIASLQEKQIIADTSLEDADIVGCAILSHRAHIVLFQRRQGKIIQEYSVALSGTADSTADLLGQFLPQYYASTEDIPPMILVGDDFPERSTVAEWMSQILGKRVTIAIPERGIKSQLLLMAEKNAAQKILQQEAAWEADHRNTASALEQLQSLLFLPTFPRRIEAYDISHLGGTETVGSMVVFLGGKPAPDHYRSFTIQSLSRGDIDDYRSLKEVLSRRLSHLNASLTLEASRLLQEGISLRRPRKADHSAITEIFSQQCPEEPSIPKNAQVSLVSTEQLIIGLACVHPLGKALFLSCLWSDPSHANLRAVRALLRMVCKRAKKTKIYGAFLPSMEPLLLEMGFHLVSQGPEASLLALSHIRRHRPGYQKALLYAYDPRKQGIDRSLAAAPDLLVIDGGKGQLSAVQSVLSSMALSIPVIGLAKREEEVFVQGSSDPVAFPSDAPGKFLLMRLPDEAHRRANLHRETRMTRASTHSLLDTIDAIGPKTKKALLQRFGSVAAVSRASDAELLTILTVSQLQALREALSS